ncbi:MAG: inorganic diphosphatase, partial [Bacteroidota bacterium]
FIPQTLAETIHIGTTLICDKTKISRGSLSSQINVVPMCIVSAKVVGVMHMLDDGERDDKIIAVAQNDMSVNFINDISELPNHFINELKTFFEDYKKLENKTVEIEEFQDNTVAKRVVLQSMEDYKARFLR